MLALELQALQVRISEPAERKCVDGKLARINTGLHRISHRLHPSIVRDLGLSAAIEGECRDFAGRLGIPVQFQAHSPLDELPPPNILALFRIVQEASHNVAKHARASSVHVSLERCANFVYLLIEDSGRGFDPDQPTAGLELKSRGERAALVDGSVVI